MGAGSTPTVARKAAQAALADTFGALAEEWFALASKSLSEITIAKARWMLDDYVLPEIGNVAIEAVNAPILLRMLRKIEAKGFTKQRTVASNVVRKSSAIALQPAALTVIRPTTFVARL